MKDYQKKSDDYSKKNDSPSTMIYVVCGVVLIATLLWYAKSRNKNVEPENPQEEVVDELCEVDAACQEVDACEVVECQAVEFDEEDEAYEEDVFEELACEVAEPSSTATDTEVLYVGVANPIEVQFPDVPAENIECSISGQNSIVRRSANKYIVMVKSVGEVTINFYANIDGQRKNIASKTYIAKRLPDPVATIDNKRGGTIARATLLKSPIKAVLEDLDFDVKFPIVKFTVSAYIDGFEQSAESTSGRYTAQQTKIISQMQPGETVTISGIKAKGPDGTTRDLGSLSFKVQ